jgi:methylenetetrahydrofolate--tRNA-(uracil-5-)-methyltransferase
MRARDAARGVGHGGVGGGLSTATVIGGGLAGSEAAWALAERGIRVRLVEMRPQRMTPAHKTGRLAELVCSNTFKSTELTTAHGLLKAEMRRLGSIVLDAADESRVPGGTALAVDRAAFAERVEARLLAHANIELVREEAVDLPSPGIVATGPLTSDALAETVTRRLGARSLAFFDAIAPIVSADSLDQERLFRASRYGKGEGADYLNAPLTREEYERFVQALLTAEQYRPEHEFDAVSYFEGCLPIEVMAQRGPDTLRFGPMKAVGLTPPDRHALKPYAVVQLRQEDRAGQMWNLVGFQTRLKMPEQLRVFRMIPGLQGAEFLRYGSIHRNSYINSPGALTPHLSAKDDRLLLFAGQLTGVEGYTESAATGMLAGLNLARMLHGEEPLIPPPRTMLGALYRYLREADPAHFQPMNANFGLLDALEMPVRDRVKRNGMLAQRALEAMDRFASAECGVRSAD